MLAQSRIQYIFIICIVSVIVGYPIIGASEEGWPTGYARSSEPLPSPVRPWSYEADQSGWYDTRTPGLGSKHILPNASQNNDPWQSGSKQQSRPWGEVPKDYAPDFYPDSRQNPGYDSSPYPTPHQPEPIYKPQPYRTEPYPSHVTPAPLTDEYSRSPYEYRSNTYDNAQPNAPYHPSTPLPYSNLPLERVPYDSRTDSIAPPNYDPSFNPWSSPEMNNHEVLQWWNRQLPYEQTDPYYRR
ncbi:MAG: hypothetical protein H7832_05645 [Magnetococcus sp. DMHC-6]